MAFAAYELASHPDIQQTLYEEIRGMNETLNNKRVNYESIVQLKYLDQVISEVLRKWLSFIMNDRVYSKDFNFDDGEEHKFVIKKGGFDPEKFDPTRSRFAIMETQAAFYHLLLNFSLHSSEQTEAPLQFRSKNFGLKWRKC